MARSGGLDGILDRALAATSGMIFALCALTALVIWWRILAYRPPMLAAGSPPPHAPAISTVDTKGLVVATGVAFLAIALRYGLTAGGRLGFFHWSTFPFDLASLTSDVAVIASALVAVRAATLQACGYYAVAIFGGVSSAVGVAVYFGS